MKGGNGVREANVITLTPERRTKMMANKGTHLKLTRSSQSSRSFKNKNSLRSLRSLRLKILRRGQLESDSTVCVRGSKRNYAPIGRFVTAFQLLYSPTIGLPFVPREDSGRTVNESDLSRGSSSLGMLSDVTPPFGSFPMLRLTPDA